ncbi:Semaphorin-5B [Symbiodinium microadriaticum]|uniref:Semaphorin-5B n=1 Tax=Symbiodinium microadriaticum TaxID=2951 RepID=A0A1Q9DCY2_SYMMI|nr:Semaphorin-5B [Symbiodinium microadriaticum]
MFSRLTLCWAALPLTVAFLPALQLDDECQTGECALEALQLKGGLVEDVDADSSCEDSTGGACMDDVMWAKNEGIRSHPDWYPGLSQGSSLPEFQCQVYKANPAKCPKPCSVSCTGPVAQPNRSPTVAAPSCAGKEQQDACLCVFDIDRTLTSKQGQHAVALADCGDRCSRSPNPVSLGLPSQLDAEVVAATQLESQLHVAPTTAEAVASSSAPTAEPELSDAASENYSPDAKSTGHWAGYESDWASCAAASPGYIYLLYFLSRIGSWPVGRLIVLQHVEVAWLLNKEAPHQSKRKQSLDKGVLSGVGQRLPQICEVLEMFVHMFVRFYHGAPQLPRPESASDVKFGTDVCPGSSASDGIVDTAYGGGDLVLSALAAARISGTFCEKCYLGICSHGDGSGANSREREELLHQVLRSDAMDKFQMKPQNAAWSDMKLLSPYVVAQPDGRKQDAVAQILEWYASQQVCIPKSNTYFFDDKDANILPFRGTGMNAHQISCDSRDPQLGWGEVGFCGATLPEIRDQKGVTVCKIDCKWSDWSAWGGCSKSCGGGSRQRNRRIIIKTRNGGQDCPGSALDHQECNAEACPTTTTTTTTATESAAAVEATAEADDEEDISDVDRSNMQ